jgi:hypothetical protein
VLAVPDRVGTPLVMAAWLAGLAIVTVGVVAVMVMVPLAEHVPMTLALTVAAIVWPWLTTMGPVGTETLPRMQPSPEPLQPVLVTVTVWLDVNGLVQMMLADWPGAAVMVLVPPPAVTLPTYDHDGWPYFISGLAPVKSPGCAQL